MQLIQQQEGPFLGFLAHGGDIHLALRQLGELHLLGLQGHHDAVQPQAEAQAGGGLAAEFLHQAVVPAAAAQGKAQALGGELEHSAGVVIQAADQAGVYLKLDAQGGQKLLNLGKVGFAVLAQVVGDLGRALAHLLALGAFAVQDAHGVALQPGEAGVAQLVLPGGEVLLQGLVVLLAAFGAADGVQLQAHILQA